jgi:hypothetical protein
VRPLASLCGYSLHVRGGPPLDMPVRSHRDDDISFGCGVGPAVPGVAAGGSVRFGSMGQYVALRDHRRRCFGCKFEMV